MKLKLKTYHSKHSWDITCCKDKSVKITKTESGRCFVKLWVKCKVCGLKGRFTHWYEEGYNPSKEEKEKYGDERVRKSNTYSFEVLNNKGGFSE